MAKMGPSYTKLFVGYIDNYFIFTYYKRYISDCDSATSSTEQRSTQSIHYLSEFFAPGSKTTWEIPENSLPFLDIKLSSNDNGLSTSVRYKPADSHNYFYIRPLIHNT